MGTSWQLPLRVRRIRQIAPKLLRQRIQKVTGSQYKTFPGCLVDKYDKGN